MSEEVIAMNESLVLGGFHLAKRRVSVYYNINGAQTMDISDGFTENKV